MALKFLNKKGWHTGSLRNVENVWKAEQKHEAEQKKLEEIRKQIQEEKERNEFRLLQEKAGLVPKQERLEFLYDSGLSVGRSANNEGFKELQALPTTDGANVPSSSSSKQQQPSVPGALFEDKPQSANDAWRKLHSDPLLMIRQREQEALARIKNNPVKMAMIRKTVEATEHKKAGDKRKSHKKHRHDSSKHEKLLRRQYNSDDDATEGRKGKSDDRNPPDYLERHTEAHSNSENESSERDKQRKRDHHKDREYKEHSPSERDERYRGRSPRGRDKKHRGQSHDDRDERYKGRLPSDKVERHRGRSPSSRDKRHRGQSPHDRDQRYRGQSPSEKDERHRGRSPSGRDKRHRGQSPDDRYESYRGWSPSGRDKRHRGQSPDDRYESYRGWSPSDRDKKRKMKEYSQGNGDRNYDKSRLESVDAKRENGSFPEARSNGSSVTEIRRESHNRRRNVAPKLSEEERAAKLRQMQLAAELHEEQRWKRLKKADENDAQEAIQSSVSGSKNFLDAAQKSVYGAGEGGSSSIAESVRRRTHYSQGRSAAGEGNAFRR